MESFVPATPSRWWLFVGTVVRGPPDPGENQLEHPWTPLTLVKPNQVPKSVVFFHDSFFYRRKTGNAPIKSDDRQPTVWNGVHFHNDVIRVGEEKENGLGFWPTLRQFPGENVRRRETIESRNVVCETNA